MTKRSLKLIGMWSSSGDCIKFALHLSDSVGSLWLSLRNLGTGPCLNRKVELAWEFGIPFTFRSSMLAEASLTSSASSSIDDVSTSLPDTYLGGSIICLSAGSSNPIVLAIPAI